MGTVFYSPCVVFLEEKFKTADREIKNGERTIKMYEYIHKIEQRLSGEDRKLLSDIFSPTVVAIPDEDPFRSLCVTDDGRIRFYGLYQKKSVFDTDCKRCYIESCDGGLSWKRHLIENKDTLGVADKIPYNGKYISLKGEEGTGTVALIGNSLDDTNPRKILVSDTVLKDFKHPLFMRSRERIIAVCCEERREIHPTAYFNVLCISDDCGETWKLVHTEGIPLYEKKWPHKGFRWQQNTRENAIAELSDGRLMMITRTSEDYHYISYSIDGGDSWSKPEKSCFHSTGTMPHLTRLSDGRLLFFWCNTKLLPELAGADGVWEDVFTNRDANHVAISEDDGKTWLGFRELFLNPLRCSADFRSSGGPEDTRDKSVHQFETLELPMGKMLVAFGQHPVCRRIAIFDIRWLYEKSRKEDFIHGLASLSTQTYVKSILGGHRGTPQNPNARVGHCAYNRTNSVLLVPSPEHDGREALHICTTDDERLVSNIGGAVWNFPIAKKGRITVRLFVKGEGLRLSLLDHWMNPTDDTVAYFSNFSFVVRPDMMHGDAFYTDIVLDFDCFTNTVKVSSGDYLNLVFHMQNTNYPNGLCYLHTQSAARTKDMLGSLIACIEFEADKSR